MTAATLNVTVRPLSPALGAEISGVDLSRPLGDAAFAAVHEAWLRHQVILFRGQTLDEDGQIAFAQRFGELQPVRTTPGLYANPYVLMVTNVVIDGKKGALPDGEMQFHSDQCYYENPAKATMLFGIEVPPSGGDTLFSSATAVYESLPAATQAKIDGLQALNVYDYGGGATVKGTVADDAPKFVHPVVRTHPETGRKGVYVNRLMTDHIVGLPRAESEALLEELFLQIEKPAFVYAHKWRVGDLVMWDNRCALHARTDFDPGTRRMMRRVTVKGDRPF
ncbi:MAG TPA: TauD/TfdA family dioxygenase [Alphaproteobacteria bacterium]|jgi:taurine dioxygenase